MEVVIGGLGGLQQMQFQAVDLLIQGIDQLQIDIDTESTAGVIEVFANPVAVALVAEVARRLGEVLLQMQDLDVFQEFGSAADEEGASSHEVAGGTQVLRIGVGHGEVATSEETGDLFGVDGVVLDLAAMDGLHIERMPEDEGDLLLLTPIGEPVPVECRLAAEDEIGPDEGLQIERESVDLSRAEVAVESFLPLVIKDADMQTVAVQIDAGVELVLPIVEFHHVPPWAVGFEPVTF